MNTKKLKRILKKDFECPACFNVIAAGQTVYLDLEYFQSHQESVYCCKDCTDKEIIKQAEGGVI